jgi:hypothetical protein
MDGYDVRGYFPPDEDVRRHLRLGRLRLAHGFTLAELTQRIELSFGLVHGVRIPWESQDACRLGPLEGVRLISRTTGTLFMISPNPDVTGSTEAYILEYHRAGRLHERDIRLCEKVAGSVEPGPVAEGG